MRSFFSNKSDSGESLNPEVFSDILKTFDNLGTTLIEKFNVVMNKENLLSLKLDMIFNLVVLMLKVSFSGGLSESESVMYGKKFNEFTGKFKALADVYVYEFDEASDILNREGGSTERNADDDDGSGDDDDGDDDDNGDDDEENGKTN